MFGAHLFHVYVFGSFKGFPILHFKHRLVNNLKDERRSLQMRNPDVSFDLILNRTRVFSRQSSSRRNFPNLDANSRDGVDETTLTRVVYLIGEI